MHQPALYLALALLSQAEPAAPAKGELVPEAPPGVRIEHATDAENPPAGTPEELKLWREGIDVYQRVTLVRRESFNLRASAKKQNLTERLAALRTQVEHEQAEKLAAHNRTLVKSFQENVEIYSRQWPVDPTRVCGYPLMNYDSSLRMAPGPNRQAEVSNAAPDLRKCAQQARGAADRLAGSNKRLAEVIQEVVRAVEAAEAHVKHEAHEKQERQGGEAR